MLIASFIKFGFSPKRERVVEILNDNSNFNYDYFCYVLNDGENQKDLTKETFNKIKGDFSIEIYKAASIAASKPKTKKTQIFDKVSELYGNTFTRKQIVSCILVVNKIVKSVEDYNWRNHRGIYSCALSAYGTDYFYIPGKDGRYLQKISKGVYKLCGTKK